MTGESELHPELADRRSSSPPTSAREKVQAGGIEGAGGVAETSTPMAEGPDPEKAVHTHDGVQDGLFGTIASGITPDSAAVGANPTSNDFGHEDNDYISGYKLYAALFSIISVFFLVLLDFSISATVSKDSRRSHYEPRILHRCPNDDCGWTVWPFS
ncbi:putative Major facilitator superfamily (MFS) profile domain-containing protein [Seiridium unicorne]|uniref:Major facilitator superfamily (MFS) profile domain-containing protein n=1 Tax=Seiridium unicorne TaxID=138068 RepID=A0ABR2UK57_9PEZI